MHETFFSLKKFNHTLRYNCDFKYECFYLVKECTYKNMKLNICNKLIKTIKLYLYRDFFVKFLKYLIIISFLIFFSENIL